MSSVSFSGLATGLDTGSIVAQLVELKRQPIYRLESRKKGYQDQITALGKLKTKLLALQTAATKMDTANEFSSLKAATSNSDGLTVTAGAGAAPGRFDIVVNTLARAQKEQSQGFDSKLDAVGSGTISITVGEETHELTLTGYTSLEGLAALINDNVEGVSAAIINDGSGSQAYRLMVSGSEAGSAGAFTLDLSGLSGGVSPVMSTVTAAADAALTVDGIPVIATSNNPSDVISGITLHLLEEGAAATVTVERDLEGIAGKVKGLVDAYNDLFGFIKDQSAPAGTLRDNPSLRSVASRIENIFTSGLTGGLGDITLFAQLGVTRGEARQIEFDEADFKEALQSNFGAVRDFFIERDGNLGKTYLIDHAIDDMTDSFDGLFKISTDALNKRISSTETTIDRYERSIDSYRTTMERRFAAMELMVSQLQAQGNYLASVMYQ